MIGRKEDTNVMQIEMDGLIEGKCGRKVSMALEE
jgi:hypothetical protein